MTVMTSLEAAELSPELQQELDTLVAECDRLVDAGHSSATRSNGGGGGDGGGDDGADDDDYDADASAEGNADPDAGCSSRTQFFRSTLARSARCVPPESRECRSDFVTRQRPTCQTHRVH